MMTFSDFLVETSLVVGDMVEPLAGPRKGAAGKVAIVGTNDRKWMVAVVFDKTTEWIPIASLKKVP